MENIKMRLRTEMCNMLCSMGHNMEELEECSMSELMNMCQDKMNMEKMMENHDMSRTEMCMMLCNMGHKIEELEVCSNEELMNMCQGKMNMTMSNKMNMDKEMMENNSSRIIKGWKNFK
jgi:hypothetical protein